MSPPGTRAARSAEPAFRGRVTDAFMPKIEEWVEASRGRIRADKAHEKLLALGYRGSDRSTRRAIAQVRAAYRLGHVRVHRPWITEPGMWLQYDFGDGPVIDGRRRCCSSPGWRGRGSGS